MTVYLGAFKKRVLRILWYVYLLLGNDSEISNYTTAVTRQWPVNSKRNGVSCAVRGEML
jgi:hypothetical protein